MKQWEDWIIFLGFRDEQYGDAVDAIGKWKGTLTGSDLNGDDLHRLNGLLFNGPDRIIQHSCCLGLGSMRVANGVIEAGWVDGGGLSHPHWRENLKLASAIQSELLDENPSLMRPMLLRNSRYNQHATTGSLLVEVGAAGNSPEEAETAARLFAEGMVEVLKG